MGLMWSAVLRRCFPLRLSWVVERQDWLHRRRRQQRHAKGHRVE